MDKNNSSKIEREKLLDDGKKISLKNNNKEIAKFINDITNYINNQKTFGLVFDKYKSSIRDLKKIKIEKLKDSVSCKNGINHQLYIGDNIDTLVFLQKEYKNKIDIIYIDPPYNALGQTIVYEDKRKPDEWCSFIYDRLILLRDLLNEEGFIAVSIGNAGQAQMKLLLDEVFGWENFVMHMPRRQKENLSAATSKIIREHDYVYIYAKNWKKAWYILYEPFEERIPSLEFTKDIYSNEEGSRELKKYTQFPFTDPKPLKLIEKLLSISPKKNTLILDIFAGSGTTIEAGIKFNVEHNNKVEVIACQLDEKIIDDKWKKEYPDISYVTIERSLKSLKQYNSKDGINIFRIK